MTRLLHFLILSIAVCLFSPAVHAETNCYLINECSHFRRDPSAGPSPGTQLKINPSAVPTDKGFGLEAIYHSVSPDLAIIRGNGRMGAALSPSNSEETFFGAPGFENSDEFLERKQNQKKYPNQKVTLATAFEIVDKKGSGFRNYSLKMGAMAKYNKLSEGITPGAGFNGTWGPFSAGYSVYKDETQLEFVPDQIEVVKYDVATYNVGLYLTSLILNYSNMRLETEDKSYLATIQLYTASLTLGKFIITGAKRTEDSPAPRYNYETKDLEFKKIKEDYFAGVQYSLTKSFLLGALYNYYQLHEFSVSATLFF